LRTSLLFLTVFSLLVTFQAQSHAQSITAGDVTGTVTDPTGAAIPGAQAYNALNHPNFDNPVADISNPMFGSSVAEVAPLHQPARCVRAWYGRFSALRGDQERTPILKFFRRAYPPRRILYRLGSRTEEKTSEDDGNNFAG
jgi:hypothetical protein